VTAVAVGLAAPILKAFQPISPYTHRHSI